MTFQPRRAIVTASDSGIGRATAVALAAAGLDVGVTWHRDEAGAHDTAAEVREAGVKAEVAQLDTADLDACGDVIDDLAGSSPSPACTSTSPGSARPPTTRPSTAWAA